MYEILQITTSCPFMFLRYSCLKSWHSFWFTLFVWWRTFLLIVENNKAWQLIKYMLNNLMDTQKKEERNLALCATRLGLNATLLVHTEVQWIARENILTRVLNFKIYLRSFCVKRDQFCFSVIYIRILQFICISCRCVWKYKLIEYFTASWRSDHFGAFWVRNMGTMNFHLFESTRPVHPVETEVCDSVVIRKSENCYGRNYSKLLGS
jgi:hypothetical protein